MSKFIWFAVAALLMTELIVRIRVPEEILIGISSFILGAFLSFGISDYFIGETESSSFKLLERYRKDPEMFLRHNGINYTKLIDKSEVEK